jgi:hypothetical protein
MEKIFLGLGTVLVLINTAIGLVFNAYSPFNMVMADISILLSTVLIYGAYVSRMADGFKIGFTVLFAITGLIRFVCSVFSPEQFKDSMAFLVFIIILAIEGLSFFVGYSLKNK